jgi:hypothetical protein
MHQPRHCMEVDGQLHAPAVLLPAKGLLYSLDGGGGVGGPQSQFERCGEKKKILHSLAWN